MGEIITFYSYKGGSGRSMALANAAAATAMREIGKKILMIDWDLEAPGLEYYFDKYINPLELNGKEGIFDFVKKAEKKLPKMIYGEEDTVVLNTLFNELSTSLIKVDIPYATSELCLLKSGKQTTDYAEQINKFNWERFYKKIPAFFTLFAEYLWNEFDYVFIDARTGHTGIGGISTMIMPEKLVLVFTPNQQSLEGIMRIAEKAIAYRVHSNDVRPLTIYPLPSRVDERSVKLREEWREKYERKFTESFQEIYALPPTISLKSYFDKVQIQHSAEYAYGEKIAILEEASIVNSMSESYRTFTKYLLNSEKIWTNEPFSNLDKPYQIFFAFAKQDRELIEQLNIHLGGLKRQNAIYLKKELKDYLSVEQWDREIQQKLGNEDIVKEKHNTYDLVIVLGSTAFFNEKNNWEKHLTFKDSDTNKLFINVNLSEIPKELAAFPFTPSRRKNYDDYLDKDEALTIIVKDIKNKLINHHGKSRKPNT